MRLVEHRGKWAARIEGRRFSTGFEATEANRGDADRKAREFLSDIIKAQIESRCGSIVEAYIADMPNRAVPKTPSQPLLYHKKAVLSFFANHTPEEVTRDECRAYIKKRRAMGRADGTIRKELGVLQAGLRWHNPETPARFDLPAQSQPRERWLNRDEVKRLVAAADLTHLKTFIHIALCTGARKEAICEMQWDTHIDFEKRTIWPGFKPGGKKRAKPIPMTEAAYKWLLVAHQTSETPWAVEWAGNRVKDVKKGLRAVYERADIEDVDAPAHVLRHTAGAWMAIDAVPMFEIATRLGHSSTKTTEKHYAHLHPDFMDASTAALEI